MINVFHRCFVFLLYIEFYLPNCTIPKTDCVFLLYSCEFEIFKMNFVVSLDIVISYLPWMLQ